MSNAPVLHISTGDKFIPPFIDFLHENNIANNSVFFITNMKRSKTYNHCSTVYFEDEFHTRLFALMRLIQLCYQSEKIILHGLFDIRIVTMLFFQPWLLKKCYWVIWGGDLYCHKLNERTWKWKVSEFFRRSVIRKIGHLVTYIEGDVELARQWYGAEGKYHECLMYPSNVFQEASENAEPHRGINILVGHSASPFNNHIEIFECLKPFRDRDIALYVPLSYGDEEYARSVISTGKSLFGEKFFPVTNFMSRHKYLSFLNNMDIAIFNHNRQQAMGNTITLLGYGKKVYMRRNTAQWKIFRESGIFVYDVTSVNLKKIKYSIKKNNQQQIREIFSTQTLSNQLKVLFG